MKTKEKTYALVVAFLTVSFATAVAATYATSVAPIALLGLISLVSALCSAFVSIGAADPNGDKNE